MVQELQFGLLGPLLVRRDETTVPIAAGKQRVLVAALLLNTEPALTPDGLAELLWPAGPPPSARVTVRNYVKRLRRALGDDGRRLVATQSDGYLLRVPSSCLDTSRFEVMTAGGRQALRAGQHAEAAAALRAALALWRGRPLADVPCDQLVIQHGPRLEELRLQALEDRIEADLHCGRHAEVITDLQPLTAAEPLRERLHGLLMLALDRAGRRADALAAFQDARRVLIDEIGVEPGAELRRLHERILAGEPALADGISARPAAAAPPVPHQLPAASAHFVGRQPELDRLDTMVPVTVIGGTAGVGKTALAIHWAHRAASQFPDGQLYLNLRGFSPDAAPASPGEGLGVLLDALRPSVPIPSELDARMNLYRSLVAAKRLLIVLDNARDAGQVRPLLPGSLGSMVVITSRDWLAGLSATDGAQLITLNVLAKPEARALIAARIGRVRADGEPGAVEEIAELCGRLPLALAVAAAKVAARPAFSLGQLAAELRDPGARLDVLDAGEALASARSVISWSYASLTAPAAMMLRLLGLHPGPDAGVGAVASLAAVPAGQAHGMLAELARSNVVAETTAGRFGLHDLLRTYAREQAHAKEPAGHRQAAIHRMLNYYLHSAHAMSGRLYPTRPSIILAPLQAGVLPAGLAAYQQAWAWGEAEAAVLRGMVTLAPEAGLPEHAWQLVWAFETFLTRCGRWDLLNDLQRLALQTARGAGDTTGEAHASCGLGWARVLQGYYGSGREHLDRAARLFSLLGDASGEARAHVRTGDAFWRQGRLAEARQSAERALDLFRACDDQAGQAGALNNIGLLHIHLGAYQHGLSCCQQSRVMFRALGYRRGEANALDSMGEAYRGLGRAADATACFQQSLSAVRELGDQVSQAEILVHLAAVRQDDGNVRAARDCLRQALAIFAGLQHPDTAQIQAKLIEMDTSTIGSRHH